MSPPPPRRPSPRSASPADRSVEFAAHQKQLKEEAAERRERAALEPKVEKKRTKHRAG